MKFVCPVATLLFRVERPVSGMTVGAETMDMADDGSELQRRLASPDHAKEQDVPLESSNKPPLTRAVPCISTTNSLGRTMRRMTTPFPTLLLLHHTSSCRRTDLTHSGKLSLSVPRPRAEERWCS